ncbi:hypothetical protein [Pseudochrobactrum sp. XF203]|uniref:hypothetical protein n=1 Tax=Pseudochrobactrum sp. XF203 TaxID=2879116 RepID=UPI001CE2FC67|nr:hypothetical protein [Pseudochrobactrum sp. XF203]UCA47616.1 hypothetical protein LDL70_16310 [Pseudochrobactrum sp. XF203]
MQTEIIALSALAVTIAGALYSWAYKAPKSFSQYSQMFAMIITCASLLVVSYMHGYNSGLIGASKLQEKYVNTSELEYSIILIFIIGLTGLITQYLCKLIGIIANSIRDEGSANSSSQNK